MDNNNITFHPTSSSITTASPWHWIPAESPSACWPTNNHQAHTPSFRHCQLVKIHILLNSLPCWASPSQMAAIDSTVAAFHGSHMHKIHVFQMAPTVWCYNRGSWSQRCVRVGRGIIVFHKNSICEGFEVSSVCATLHQHTNEKPENCCWTIVWAVFLITSEVLN